MNRVVLYLGFMLAIFTAAGCAMESSESAMDNSSDDEESSGDADGDGDADDDDAFDDDDDEDDEDEQDTENDEDEEDTDSEDDEDECDTDNEVVLYLSADDSNSMAGPVIARELIRSGRRVGKAIRTWEFLNYYNFNYEAAEPGTVNVTAQMRVNEDPVDDYDQSYNLQIGVRGADQIAQDRRPLNITLSLDTSGSMGGDPIQRVRDCCLALAGSMQSGDVVSMVTWSDEQSILLESHVVSGPNDSTLVNRCRSISPGGSTNLHAGLVTAYQLAEANFDENRINRVILMSDGGANVGVTDETMIAENADDSEGEGIYMMGVGMGDADFYNDVLMDTVTDAGKGAYIFVDSAEEAKRMFGERFLSNVEVAARDVRVELTMPPSFEMVLFSGEESSEDPDEVEPQHLAPNDAMIYHQIVATCDQSVVDMGSKIKINADYYHPFTLTPQTASFEATLEELLLADKSQLLKGDAIVAYAETLKQVKSMSGQEAKAVIDSTLSIVQTASDALASDPDLIEISSLLTTYRNYF